MKTAKTGGPDQLSNASNNINLAAHGDERTLVTPTSSLQHLELLTSSTFQGPLDMTIPSRRMAQNIQGAGDKGPDPP